MEGVYRGVEIVFDGYNKFVCLWPDRLWEDIHNARKPCKLAITVYCVWNVLCGCVGVCDGGGVCGRSVWRY